MTVTVDAYNVSSSAVLLNGLPRYVLTLDGLSSYHNKTFDITDRHYINSLLITFFASPFALLFVTLTFYVIFISFVRYFNTSNPAAAASVGIIKHDPEWVYSSKDDRKDHHCQHCRAFWIIVIGFSIVIAIMGTILFLQGTLQTDNLIREFNSHSTESKRSIGNFSRRYLPADHQNKSTGILSRSMNRFFSRFNTYKTMKLYANQTTIDASQANAEWFENRFFLTILFYGSSNILSILTFSIFWFLLISLPYSKIRSRTLLIYCMKCLLMITFMLGL